MAGMRYQPQGRVQIDWSNPITQGLAFAFVHGAVALGWQAGIGDTFYSYGASSVPTANPKGQALRVSGSSGPGAYQLRGIAGTSNSYSILAVASTSDVSGTASALDADNGTVERNFQFRLNAGRAEVIPFAGTTTTGVATFPTAMTSAEAAQGFVIGATVSPAGSSAWQRGRKATATMNAGAPNNFPPYPAVGSRVIGTQRWASGGINMHACWMRVLSDAEMQSLAANPWQIFLDPYEEDYFAPASSAPVGYTLTAAPGAFSLAGPAATLRAARVLPAAPGVFGLAGSSAGLAASRRLTAASGAFGLSGSSAGLLASRRLRGGPGALSLSGGSAGLIAGRRLVTGAGGFALSGGAVVLLAARRLSVAPGAFVLSGSAAQLTYQQADNPNGGKASYTLSAAPGSFGLSGSGVTLRAARRMAAAPGALAFAGSAAVLAYGRRLSAASGAFDLQGTAVLLRADRRMPARAGMFELVGMPAQLRYSAQIEYARAPAGSGYAPQRHEYSSRPSATSSPRPAAIQRNLR